MDYYRTFKDISNDIRFDILLLPNAAQGHLPKPNSLSSDRTFKIRANSKRTFYALSNGIYINIILLPKSVQGFRQSRAKTGNLPKPKKLCGVCTLKVRVDSRRTFYALSNGIYINILFLSNIGRKFGQSWAK